MRRDAPRALRRELDEEVGLAVDTDPPHVWHQQVVAPGHATGYDGVVNDYFLVRTASFRPRGAMSDDELAAECVRCPGDRALLTGRPGCSGRRGAGAARRAAR